MKACNKATWEGFRNYVILLTFLDTGIRLSKLLSLTLKDVNLNKRSLLIHGKGGKDREVYMGKTLTKEFNKWMKKRGSFPYADIVFTTRQGCGLKKRGLSQIIERLADKAPIQGMRDVQPTP